MGMDVTAVGIPPNIFAECSSTPISLRGSKGCGDYTQLSGVITFGPGELKKSVRMYTMNDACKEMYQEYARMQLSVPGGNTLIGETKVSYLRIDDDDDSLTDLCTPTINTSPNSPFYSTNSVPNTFGKKSTEIQY